MAKNTNKKKNVNTETKRKSLISKKLKKIRGGTNTNFQEFLEAEAKRRNT